MFQVSFLHCVRFSNVKRQTFEERLAHKTSRSIEDEVRHRNEVNTNWQDVSLQLCGKNELKTVSSESLVDFENLVNCFQAVPNRDFGRE